MSKWIPCSERLPELGQQVLTFRKKTNHSFSKKPVHICLVHRVKCTGLVSANNEGFDYTWQEYGPMAYWGWEMTHWQPVSSYEPITTQDIQNVITKYLAGEITLGDFQDWLAPHAWENDLDQLVSGLIYSIELRISEYDAGHLPLDDFTSELKKLV